MDLSTSPYPWLAGSLLAAVVVDWVIARVLMELLRPASGWVFWIGRTSKLLTVVLWLVFFNSFLYPRFFGGAEVPPTVIAIQAAVVGLLLLAAFVTLPRATRRLRDSNG